MPEIKDVLTPGDSTPETKARDMSKRARGVVHRIQGSGPLSASSATNNGQYRNNFQVVIAGSNGCTNNSVAAVPGYGPATYLGNAAINAPYDQNGFNSYMGSAIFVGTFDANLCAQACTQKSQYALAHPPTDGTPVQTCQLTPQTFFNTYILYINTTANTQGQYCAMYSESWSPSYATNSGQYRGSDHFLIEYSFTYSNSTNPGSANPLAAVYQARKDINWPANSAQPYCSAILGYTTPVATVTSTTTTTPLATAITVVTQTVTSTTQVFQKRQEGATASAIISTSANQLVRIGVVTPTATLAQRAVSSAIATPAVLTKYPASIVTSACSLAVTSPSVTSYVTSTVTATAATSTASTISSFTTTTAVVTSTSTTSQPAAPSSFPGVACGSSTSASDGVQWPTECNQGYSGQGDPVYLETTSASSFQDCVNQAENSSQGFAVDYDSSTGNCAMYGFHLASPNFIYSYNAGHIVAWTDPITGSAAS